MGRIQERVGQVLRQIYNQTLREAQIRYRYVKPNYRSGIAVPEQALFTDRTHYFDYKIPGIELIRKVVKEGDHVIDIAAGRGVFATVAALEGADVTSFEGSQRNVAKAQRTARAQFVEDRITIRHAVVGTTTNIHGPMRGATELSPKNLPTCDVLVLDCDGTEIEILNNMDIKPRAAIVETHPHWDAPTKESEAILRKRGYNITERVSKSPAHLDTHFLLAQKAP